MRRFAPRSPRTMTLPRQTTPIAGRPSTAPVSLPAMAPAAFLPAWVCPTTPTRCKSAAAVPGPEPAPWNGAGQAGSPAKARYASPTGTRRPGSPAASSPTAPISHRCGFASGLQNYQLRRRSRRRGRRRRRRHGLLSDGRRLRPYDTGAFGGSLGYTCSNVNNDPNLVRTARPRHTTDWRTPT